MGSRRLSQPFGGSAFREEKAMNQKDTWQQMLVDTYPLLFVRSFRGVKFSPGYPTCGDGWCDIVTKLVERVSAAAVGYPMHFTQILERYGRLTIYWKADANLPKRVEHAIDEAIALAEARSACTCVDCGAKGQLISSGGCLFTACTEHARGIPVPIRPGTEDLHLVRTFVGDNFHSVACRRYDRVHDEFIEVDPNSLGMDHWHEILAHLGNPGGVTTRPGVDPIEPT
jgi:hypothetical protein